MKVVFLESIPNGPRVGDVKDVKNGYARNFLLPRGVALPASNAAIERAQAAMRREERRQVALDTDASKLRERIGDQPFVLRARVGETGRLYGSVTAADIAEAIDARAGTEIDRRTIELGEPIRQVGDYTIHIRLTRNVGADVQVHVRGENDEGPAHYQQAPAVPAAAAPPAESPADAPQLDETNELDEEEA
ncbi:MAG TPA: 50S ribosomal protein L9 [Dehalococcoidia bacterium]|nr:50S ribosomal protein L9 [Dehalococcoidia bacterium]